MQSWRRRVFISMSAASLVIVSGCQGQVDEPAASGPVPTEAANSATSAPASTATPVDVEAPTTGTPAAAATTTVPVAPTTTGVEPQEVAEAEGSAAVEEIAEPEADDSDEVDESDADESASVTEQPVELPPLCNELEFDPDNAAGFDTLDVSPYPPLTASNEDFEVVAAFDPSPVHAAAAAHNRDGTWRIRPEAYEPQIVIIEITDVAGRSTRHHLPLDPPEALPPHLHYAVIPQSLIVGPRGWMLATSGITYMSIRELMPDDFDERGPSLGRVTDRIWDGPNYDADGLYIYFHSGGYAADGGRHEECFVTFESLGIPYIDWLRHGTRSPKGYLSSDEYRGLIWTSEWGGTPIRSDLPIDSGQCCELFALDTGFALTTSNVPGGYWADLYWPQKLFHTQDGVHWQEVTLPLFDDALFDDGSDMDCTTWNGMDCTIWICHVESAGTAVRILEGLSVGPQGPGPCDETREWVTDPDFTNWRLQESEL